MGLVVLVLGEGTLWVGRVLGMVVDVLELLGVDAGGVLEFWFLRINVSSGLVGRCGMVTYGT